MEGLLVVLAGVVAVAAAVRSTWSPCGLSMLSTITPIGEAGRDHRYGATASWFTVGALVGGLTTGALAAVLALVVGATGVSPAAALGAAAVLSLLGAAADAGVVGPRLPHHRRQVNELWFGEYRPWAYGAGFGWQIGTGLATYIMTAAVYLTFVLAALTAHPLVALALGGLFGLARGLAVFLGWRITSPDALRSFHRRFDALGAPVRWAVIGVQLVVAAVAAGAAWGPVVPARGTGAVVLVAAAGGAVRALACSLRVPQR